MKPRRGLMTKPTFTIALLSIGVILMISPDSSRAGVSTASVGTSPASPTDTGSSLEEVASKASQTGRKVAMSLIGLAFAVAGVLLAFRRDFRDAVGVFAVGIVAVLLVTPAGLSLIRDTVNTLLGAR